MPLQYAAIVLAIGSIATMGFADTITLKNGRVINGTYLGGTARQVKVEVNDDIQTLNVSDVARIEFSGGLASAPRSDDRPTLRRANRGHAERGQSSGGPGPRSESDELRRPVCGVAHPVFDRVSADKHCVIVV